LAEHPHHYSTCEAAYNPQDVNTTRKITACLNTLGIERKLIIKPFISNPHLITALLHLHDIPVWQDSFMVKSYFSYLLHKSKWSHEVNTYHCLQLWLLMIFQTIADIFEDIHKQATILTNGQLSLLTKSELSLEWVEYQKKVDGTMLDDHCVLTKNSATMWQNVIEHIKVVHVKQPPPVLNYLINSGGSEAIQRLIDSPTTFLCNKGIYVLSHLGVAASAS